MNFKKFLQTITSSDLSEDEKQIVDNLAALSNPSSMADRREYKQTLNEVFGDGTADYFDRKSISKMLDAAKDYLPEELAEDFKEIKPELENTSLAYAEDFHDVVLATAVHSAVDELLDITIPPANLIAGQDISSSASSLMGIISDAVEENIKLPESEDEELEFSEYDFDEEEDSDY